MLTTLLASDFVRPNVDYHAIAPELILAAGICVVLLVDLFVDEAKRWITSTVAGLVLLVAALPLVTLATSGHVSGHPRALFEGRYVIDNFSLVLKALFLLIGYVVVLLSGNEIEEGNRYPGEYYVLLLSSVAGMVMMCSARDLVSVFVALELLSIPSYMLAAWRKRSSKSNEAGVKYYLLGVFASAVMLYGMSLLYGAANTTLLRGIGEQITGKGHLAGVETLGIVFVIVGFAFKISAVPFHTWAPDVYEGSPTPITAFFSVASKAAGFVALVLMVYLAFPQATDVYQPFMWVLAVLTMSIGNLLALRQTNVVRMLAYSSVSQGGFILMPLAVAGTKDAAGSSLQRGDGVPRHLRGDEPRRVGRDHRRGAQDAQRGDQQPRRPVRLRARPDGADDHLPGLAGRDPAARRLVREVRRVPCRARRRRRLGLQPGRDRRREHRDRHRVLHRADARDVDEAGTGRRRHPGARPPVAAGRAGDHGDRHGAVRRPARDHQPLWLADGPRRRVRTPLIEPG